VKIDALSCPYIAFFTATGEYATTIGLDLKPGQLVGKSSYRKLIDFIYGVDLKRAGSEERNVQVLTNTGFIACSFFFIYSNRVLQFLFSFEEWHGHQSI